MPYTGHPKYYGVIMRGDVAYPIKRAFVNASSAGDNALVTAVTGKKICVIAWDMSVDAAVDVIFRSATTAISHTFHMAANGGFVCGMNEGGWFETAAGEALNVNLSGAIATGVGVLYIEQE